MATRVIVKHTLGFQGTAEVEFSVRVLGQFKIQLPQIQSIQISVSEATQASQFLRFTRGFNFPPSCVYLLSSSSDLIFISEERNIWRRCDHTFFKAVSIVQKNARVNSALAQLNAHGILGYLKGVSWGWTE